MPDYRGQHEAQRAYDNACDCCDHPAARVEPPDLDDDWTPGRAPTGVAVPILSTPDPSSTLFGDSHWTHHNNRDDQ